ncbi:MAG: peptide chain release factor 1 [Candidatus Buchananbacteria bacterium]|nr:peptide chain release factor 1 [Candidatus Buchananbacteria bacterium]
MDKKFLEIKERYNQLSLELADTAVINNPEKLKNVSQEFSRLEGAIKKINELEKIERQLAESEATINQDEDSDLIMIAQEEISGLNELKAKLESDILDIVTPPDPMDQKNIIIEIRAGTGGDEAALFAAELFRMYSRYAESQKWKTKILSSNRIGIGGFKEVIFEIAGNQVYKNLKYESGVHRVQRVPETEKSGRVHTSAATVAVLPEAEEVDIEIKLEDLRIDVFRAGGHGGQSVNTTDSAVRITHLPTGTVVSCQDEKSQQQNKAKALQILRSRILASEQERIAKERGESRKLQIGSGDRSEKIRTYNFPQDRVTDHRIKQNFNQIELIMDGKIEPIIEALKQADR